MKLNITPHGHPFCSKPFVFVTLLFTACAPITKVSAQVLTPTEQENSWNQLKRIDGKIRIARTDWKALLVERPQPNLDVERALAQSKEQAKRLGIKPDIERQLEKNERAILEGTKRGSQTIQSFHFLRAEQNIRCVIETAKWVPLNAVPGKAESLQINFTDGNDSVFVYQALPLPGSKDKAQLVAELHRNATAKLPNVGDDRALTLTGAPLFEEYDSKNSTWRRGEKGELVLEKKVLGTAGAAGLPMVRRWFISTRTWRPIKSEFLLDVANNTNPIWRISFSDYKTYAGNVVFPSTILVENGSGSPALKNEKPSRTTEYKLEAAAFNEAVDESELLRPIPHGTYVMDKRFGEDAAVSYQIDKAIPSDEAVKKLLVQKKENQKDMDAVQSANAPAQTSPQRSSLATFSLAGALAIAGVFLWGFPARRKK